MIIHVQISNDNLIHHAGNKRKILLAFADIFSYLVFTFTSGIDLVYVLEHEIHYYL